MGAVETTSQSARILTLNTAKLNSDMAIRRAGKVLLTLIPWLGYIFLWAPIVVLIVFSFNTSRTNAVWSGFTLDWYKLLLSGQFSTEKRLSTEFLLAALQNSLIVATSATILSTILGTTIALGM